MPEIIHLSQTHSTNQYLRHLIESTRIAEEGTTIWADYQTDGRGQQGNSWESENQANLLFTLLLCPSSIQARHQFIISQVVSLGVLDVLNNIQDGFSVKWPNDIYFQNKKVAGILIENDLSGQTIYNSFIGIGLNVNQKIFISDAPNPISLYQITGKEFDREIILNRIIQQIFYYYQIAIAGDFERIQQLYMHWLFRKEGFYPFEDQYRLFHGRIKEIQLTGLLTLEDKEGKECTYDFKEVRFII